MEFYTLVRQAIVMITLLFVVAATGRFMCRVLLMASEYSLIACVAVLVDVLGAAGRKSPLAAAQGLNAIHKFCGYHLLENCQALFEAGAAPSKYLSLV